MTPAALGSQSAKRGRVVTPLSTTTVDLDRIHRAIGPLTPLARQSSAPSAGRVMAAQAGKRHARRPGFRAVPSLHEVQSVVGGAWRLTLLRGGVVFGRR
jgi:hypothetical protein